MIRPTPATPDSARRQTGVGLIEILVAVLVLSIGFLGMAALQSKALSNNNSAMARSMGTIATYSILDAMRIDPDGVDAGSYDDLEVTVKSDLSCEGVVTDGSLAAVNQQNWCDELGRLIGPGTVGRIEALDGGNYEIAIEFDDSRVSGGQTDQTLVTRAKP
jgi:type IV pilus assembly protein PilV